MSLIKVEEVHVITDLRVEGLAPLPRKGCFTLSLERSFNLTKHFSARGKRLLMSSLLATVMSVNCG